MCSCLREIFKLLNAPSDSRFHTTRTAVLIDAVILYNSANMSDNNATAGAGVPRSVSTPLGKPVYVHYKKDAPTRSHTVRVASYDMCVVDLYREMLKCPPVGGWGVDFNARGFALYHVVEPEDQKLLKDAVETVFAAKAPAAEFTKPLTTFQDASRKLPPRFVVVGGVLPSSDTLSGVKRSRVAAELDDELVDGCSMAWLRAVMRVNHAIAPRERQSALGDDAAPDVVMWNCVGEHFQLVHREEQAARLLEAFNTMEDLRTTSVNPGRERWESLKRQLNIPVCTGMPGIGKTRFTRDAIHNLAAAAQRKHQTSDILSAALQVPSSNKLLTRALVHAHDSNCNVRIECDVGCTERSVAVALLWEWGKKHFATPSDISTALKGHRLTIRAAVRLILDNTPTDDGGDGIPALIVNLDQADHPTTFELGWLLRSFLYLLIEDQLRVFVTVTAVSADKIYDALCTARFGLWNISLPLLQPHHMEEVLTAFFPEQRDKLITPALQHALWWLGGVPWFLEFFIQEARKLATTEVDASGSGKRAPVGKWLAGLDAARGVALIDNVSEAVYRGYTPLDGAIGAAFSIATAGANVYRHQILSGKTTVELAMMMRQLYWAPIEVPETTGLITLASGVVRMPPLVLRWLQKRLSKDYPRLCVLRYMIPFPTSRDNECITASALLHKFRAFNNTRDYNSIFAPNLLRPHHVQLSKLGIPTHPKFIPDVEVKLPQADGLANVDVAVTASNFSTFLARCKKEEIKTIGYINMPTASFADAFILLPDFIIFIQEEQRVLARLAGQAGRAASKVDLRREYEALGAAARSHPHVFLYITDDEDSVSKGWLKNACFVSKRDHRALLGDISAYLRASALEWSAIDVKKSRAASSTSRTRK